MQSIFSDSNRISDRKQYDTALDSWKWKHLLVISEPEKPLQEKCKKYFEVNEMERVNCFGYS